MNIEWRGMSNIIWTQVQVNLICQNLYYLRYKALHDFPKFTYKTQRIQVGNGQYVGVLFVILVIVEICSHRLEVFTLVSEIFDNIDMVSGN